MTERMRSNQELEPKPSIYLFESLKKDRKHNYFSAGPICFLAAHPGAATYFLPVAEVLADHGIEVYFSVAHKAKETVSSYANDEYRLLPRLSLPKIGWAWVGADHFPEFEINELRTMQVANPLLKIGVAEDVPGSIGKMIELLERTTSTTVVPSLKPDLVLTATRASAAQYDQQLHLSELTIPTIPVGQPTYDHIREQYPKMRQLGREALAQLIPHFNPEQAQVITFVGVPEGDYPDIHISGEVNPELGIDLNSHSLSIALNALLEVAQKNPNQNYYFVYRPHPRASELNHPLLDTFTLNAKEQGISNVFILYKDNEEWEKVGITNTRMLCPASDVVLTSLSTLGQEVAIADAQHAVPDAPIPVYLTPIDYFDEYKKREQDTEHPDPKIKISAAEALQAPNFIKRYNAALFIESPQQAVETLERALKMTLSPAEIMQEGSSFKDEYRLKAAAALRVLLWMRAVERGLV